MAECKDSSGRSPSSSMDSSTHPVLSTTSSGCRPAARRDDLSTDLQLGLSLSPASSSLLVAESKRRIPSTPRNQVLPDWPPIKPFLRSALTASARRRRTLFVKVYMEGVPIGRKLDLLLLDGYDSLLAKLRHMFKASITYADVMEYHQRAPHEKAAHVLTYEDQDGDWMMVGDVPWELFLGSREERGDTSSLRGSRDRASKMKEGTANCVDILIAIILPPLGVFLKFGCKVEFWLCLLLTFLAYLPGIIYAIYAITKD